MVFSNVIVDVAISRHSFVFGQSCAKVSAGFTNESSLAVSAFDLVYCSLSVLWFVVKWLLVCMQHVYCKVLVYVR